MKGARHLFIVNDFPPIVGGQSSYLYFLCCALDPRQILVLAPVCGDTAAFDCVQKFPIIRKPYLFSIPLLEKAAKIFLPWVWMQSLLKQEKIGLLHCAHVLSTGFIGLAMKTFAGMDYVLYTHSADVMEYQGHPLIRPWLKRILSGARYVVCNSRFTREQLTLLGVEESRIIVSAPRIDPQEFKAGVDQELLAQHGLAGRRILLSINRLVERKGNDIVLRAMPQLVRKFPGLVYVIFGCGPNEQALRVLVAELGLEKSVVFIGGGDHLRRTLLAACEVFVMISRQIKERGDAEGFGVVYLEAGACGKPVVAGDSGGVPDAVENGVNGFLVDPLDPAATARSVEALLSDPALAGVMGERGRMRVAEKFDYRRGVPELDPVFQGGH